MEDMDSAGTPATARTKIGAVLVIVALAMLFVTAGLFVYYLTLPEYEGPRCWGFFDYPELDVNVMPVPNGYMFGITSTTHVKPHDCYAVNVYKEGERLWPDHLPVAEGDLGTAVTGENLVFTDSDGNGKLSVGDFFTIENLESTTKYNFVLLSTHYVLAGSASVTTP